MDMHTLHSIVFIGILGAFTTFSTFSLETFKLFNENEITLAVSNILLNNNRSAGNTGFRG